MPVYRRPEDVESKLHELLLRAVPENEHGNKTISDLAKALGISRWAIQKWITNDTLSPKRVKEVVALSEGRVCHADFEEFIYNV